MSTQELENLIIQYHKNKELSKLGSSGKLEKIDESLKTEILTNILSYENMLKDEINEGLIKSYDINKVKNMACKKFNLNDFQVEITKRRNNGILNNQIVFMLDENTSKNIVGDLIHFMNTCGYYKLLNPRHYKGLLIITFEQKFAKDITNIVKTYKYLYHATPSINVNKILKNGLIPKHKNNVFSYPDRIYLMGTKTDELSNHQLCIMKMIQDFRDKTEHLDDNEYTILQIDIKKLPENIKFYSDPSIPDGNGVYTFDNIPNYAINIYKTLKFIKPIE